MSRLGQRDTRPELAIRSVLHRRGLRFRVQQPVDFDRRRRIDVAFPREKVAVFVDGCFWHSCPQHATFPASNAHFWKEKLAKNVQRDKDISRRLAEAGWHVIRVWEHENPEEAAALIACAVLERRDTKRWARKDRRTASESRNRP